MYHLLSLGSNNFQPSCRKVTSTGDLHRVYQRHERIQQPHPKAKLRAMLALRPEEMVDAKYAYRQSSLNFRGPLDFLRTTPPGNKFTYHRISSEEVTVNSFHQIIWIPGFTFSDQLRKKIDHPHLQHVQQGEEGHGKQYRELQLCIHQASVRSPCEAPTSRRNSSVTLIPYNSIQFLGITHLSLGHALIRL